MSMKIEVMQQSANVIRREYISTLEREVMKGCLMYAPTYNLFDDVRFEMERLSLEFFGSTLFNQKFSISGINAPVVQRIEVCTKSIWEPQCYTHSIFGYSFTLRYEPKFGNLFENNGAKEFQYTSLSFTITHSGEQTNDAKPEIDVIQNPVFFDDQIEGYQALLWAAITHDCAQIVTPYPSIEKMFFSRGDQFENWGVHEIYEKPLIFESKKRRSYPWNTPHIKKLSEPINLNLIGINWVYSYIRRDILVPIFHHSSISSPPIPLKIIFLTFLLITTVMWRILRGYYIKIPKILALHHIQ